MVDGAVGVINFVLNQIGKKETFSKFDLEEINGGTNPDNLSQQVTTPHLKM
ncbi:hypothetical protein [Spiroplasma endosymbiont of Nebria brevicollis]|uniref:hypothetical protein n=1 Tax=Spiroplasma endosymbiont of Nebria brevicollis TaxID=3066284 RepID=UPI00313AF6B8